MGRLLPEVIELWAWNLPSTENKISKMMNVRKLIFSIVKIEECLSVNYVLTSEFE